MKKVHISLFVLFFIGFIHTALSSTYLQVQDPKQTWRYGRGTIEEFSVSVIPKGIYTEYNLYLTFSSRGTYMINPQDTLEVQFYFDLPDKALVTDSWLWVGDSAVQANIIDRWTAGLVYEGIVKRRKDPSILFKNTQTSYEFRIFPMAGNQTRKARITYLLPAQWNAKSVVSPLPMNLYYTSANMPEYISLVTYPDNEWKNPRITELPDIQFSDYGSFRTASIPRSRISSNLSISFDSPVKDGVYLKYHETTANEGYYQMVLFPTFALDYRDPRKVAIMVDFDVMKSPIQPEEILSSIKAVLHNHLTPKDSFNLLFSRMFIEPVSNNWIPADSATIETTFKNLPKNVIAGYSNLPSLLYKGLEYIKSKDSDGSLLLISDSDQDGDVTVANQLITDLLATMGTKRTTIDIADFTTESNVSHYIGNQYFYANEYLYYHLALMTKGNYFKMRNNYNSLQDMLNATFQKMSGSIQTFDLYTTMKEGFCYARYDVNSIGTQPSYSSLPIMQVGRYNGTFPFSIKASGFYRNKGFSTNIELEKDKAFAGDSNTRKSWVGNYIRNLELSNDKSNETISEIIYVSMENRVLSLYTAFLALEPEMAKGDDKEHNTAVEDLGNVSSIKMTASPNPFSTSTQIRIELSDGMKSENMTINIYDMMGNIVKAITPAALVSGSSPVEFNWTGDDESGRPLPDGTYLLVVKTPHGRQVFRLIIMR